MHGGTGLAYAMSGVKERATKYVSMNDVQMGVKDDVVTNQNDQRMNSGFEIPDAHPTKELTRIFVLWNV